MARQPAIVNRQSKIGRSLKSFESRVSKLLPAACCLLLTAYCLAPTALHAQGCAMCYTSASAARAGAKEALLNGTLILLVPPVVFFAIIAVVVYKYRNRFRDSAEWQSEHDLELHKMLEEFEPVARR
jgi:CHASE2 domain-containing sensor protein